VPWKLLGSVGAVVKASVVGAGVVGAVTFALHVAADVEKSVTLLHAGCGRGVVCEQNSVQDLYEHEPGPPYVSAYSAR